MMLGIKNTSVTSPIGISQSSEIILPRQLQHHAGREISSSSSFLLKDLLPSQPTRTSDGHHKTDFSQSKRYRTLLLCLLMTYDLINITDKYKITRKCIASRDQSIFGNKWDRFKGDKDHRTLKKSLLFAQNISVVPKHHVMTAKTHTYHSHKYLHKTALKFKKRLLNQHILKYIFDRNSTRDTSGLHNEMTISPSQIYNRGKRSLEHPVRKIKYKSRLPVVLEDAAAVSNAELNSTKSVNKTELEYHFAQRFSPSHTSTTTSQMIAADPQYLGLDGKPFNMTQFKEMLKKQALIRHVSHGAEMAYLCLVGLIVAMLWTIWYLGGFARCHYQPKRHVYFSEEDNYLSVREVLEKKRQYLPMFKGKPEWEDVLMCNRGTNS